MRPVSKVIQLAIPLLLASSSAFAIDATHAASPVASNVDPAIRSCLLSNVAAVGTSVTENPANYMPYSAFVNGVETIQKMRSSRKGQTTFRPLEKRGIGSYGRGPVKIFVDSYRPSNSTTNITYFGHAFPRVQSDLGSSQILRLVDGDKQSVFQKTSLVIGIDAFYWDAVQANCGGGPGTAELAIAELIQKAKATGTTLVLGNVPHENRQNIRIDSERLGISGMWYPLDVPCTDSINNTLQTLCTLENNCYIVDIKGMVDDLNCGMKLKLANGEAYGLYEMRPDGVQLSDKGAVYVSEKIMAQMEAHPPQCQGK